MDEIIVYQELSEEYKILKEIKLNTDTEQIDVNVNNDLLIEFMDKFNEKYMEIIFKLNVWINNLSNNETAVKRLQSMKAALIYERGKMYFFINKINEAEKYFVETLEIAESIQNEPEVLYIYLKTLNHLSYLLGMNEVPQRYDEALIFLEKIYQIYKDFKTKNDFDENQSVKNVQLYDTDELYSSDSVLKPSDNIDQRFEKLATNSFEMMSFVLQKLGEIDKFLVFNHNVLERHYIMKDISVFDWTTKVNTMGSYLLYRNRFIDARHYLTAAWVRLRVYKSILLKHPELPNVKLMLGKIELIFVQIAKNWVLYGIHLFNTSKIRLTNENYEPKTDQPNTETDSTADINKTQSDNEKNNNDESKVEEMPNMYESYIDITDELGFPTTASNQVSKENLENTNQENTETNKKSVDAIFGAINLEHNYFENVDTPTTGMEACTETEIDADSGNDAEEQASTAETTNDNHENELNANCPKLNFKCFNLEKLEEKVLCTFIMNKNKARELFMHTCFMIRLVTNKINVQQKPYDYVDAVLDMNDLYGFILFYEDTVDGQYDIQLRRTDTLEMLLLILKPINHQEYCKKLYREILIELTDVQMGLIELNLTRLHIVETSQLNVNTDQNRIMEKMKLYHEATDKLNELRNFNLK